MSYEGFIKDKKTVNAVVRSLEIMGEAAKNIPERLRESYADVPWREIVGMRNKISHEYFGIDLDIVWQSTQEDLFPLESAIRRTLVDLEDNKPGII
jgi:uncharacterized protein with HEPN domain